MYVSSFYLYLQYYELLTPLTSQATYAYRSIAEFVRHVTHHDKEHLERNPFPELHRPPSDMSTQAEPDHDDRHEATANAKEMAERGLGTQKLRSDVNIYKMNEQRVVEAVKKDDDQVDKVPETDGGGRVDEQTASVNSAGQQKVSFWHNGWARY